MPDSAIPAGLPEELRKNLRDPMWRLNNLYWVVTKGDDGEDDLVVKFKPNRAQQRFIRRLWHRNIILKARQLGFCVSPETRVLTADLQWVAIADLKTGDEVVACDEHVPGGRGSARKLRTATVQATQTMQAERYRIRFDDAREVVCTANHPWLSRKVGTDASWRSLSGQGNAVTGKLKVGTRVRWITKPWGDSTVEDGWFGGMMDGEGSMALPSRAGASINVSQRIGPVWNRLRKYVEERGYSARIESDGPDRPSKHGRTPVPKVVFSRMDEMFRLLGQTRPTRFIGKRWWEGRELPGKRNGDVGWATITAIEPLGIGDVVDMQTSTGTYIAEGFVSHNTTLISILWLDHALFNANQRCGIVAQDLEAAEAIFRDKVKFAYEHLPDVLREVMPLKRDSAKELLFAHNNSAVRVATSMRSGTINRLLVSEFGKICAKFPDRAKEVVTGSIPAVPKNGITVIESTAEGRDGEFYDMTQQAMALYDQRKELTMRDYRFHFFPWWQEPNYRINPAGVVITDDDRDYFTKIEQEQGITLDLHQRAWYVATRDTDFAGKPEKMWQEYPSTPNEAFQVSTEGVYYANQLQKARTEGRIGRIPHREGTPVNTFWDLGKSDHTSIWFHQAFQFQNCFIRSYQNTGEYPAFYAQYLRDMQQEHGYVYDTHYLPHDADNETINGGSVKKQLEKLLPGQRFVVVPRIGRRIDGINMLRAAFSSCFFDEEGCKDGLISLGEYRKRFNTSTGAWTDEHVHDEHSDYADAMRQFAQGYDPAKTHIKAAEPDWKRKLRAMSGARRDPMTM